MTEVSGVIKDHHYVYIEGDANSDIVILALHGTGGDERSLNHIVRQIIPEASVLGVRGRVLENGVSRRFFNRLSTNEIDIDDMHAKISDLTKFIGEAKSNFNLESKRLIAVGFSNGANAAQELILRHPGVVDAAVLLRPVLLKTSYESNIAKDIPVLLLAGDTDPFLSRKEYIELTEKLEKTGAIVTSNLASRAEHMLTGEDIDQLNAWFEDRSQTAILAGGCFWGMQELFRELRGVISTRVGYTGGDIENATYKNHEGHAEAIEIKFDAALTSYRELLEFFFSMHDPTTPNRQGNDVGSSYRSAIFYLNERQREIAEQVISDVNSSELWPGVVVTEIVKAKEFWLAEPEHQDYLKRFPDGYTCHFIRDEWSLGKKPSSVGASIST